MALGSVTVAITLTLPPHLGQTLMSRLNTRLSRAIQLIGVLVRASSPVGRLGRRVRRGTMRWRWRALGANRPW